MKPKSFNLVYLDTKEKIINTLNEVGLPVVAMQSMINEIKQIIDINAKEIIHKERGEMNGEEV
ncbi:hypothetical protein DP149_10275 [Clostridium tetani]|uniref:hypothetical protein n=1 Tax=Clostridium tetani TaxID=1513 RepID=UPI0002E37899|nr:hypothetical protein [Clostridium tetani]KGI37953.1 hypothetical protein KY52_10525 [Clostridium tetani]KGI45324.1 hypothetical protein KY54_04235 [Clostridium tetani]KIG22130.1 hypothetical protein RS78_00450 [Clostridium tetani]RXI65807.1 hypothetical protein DP123_05385 [Clostridium tetani]RXM55076.1 hypothetical protein DP134_08950 [Clostridium tetani]